MPLILIIESLLESTYEVKIIRFSSTLFSLIQKEKVQTVSLLEDDGVLFKYALSPSFSRIDLSIWYAAASAAAAPINSGLAAPGILMTRSAAR